MKIIIRKTVATLVAVNLAAGVALAGDETKSQQQFQQSSGQQSRDSAEADSGLQRLERLGTIITEAAGAGLGDKKAKHFIKQAATESKFEVALSQLAEEKAENQRVRQFAQEVAQAHRQANQQLQQLAQQKGVQLELQQFQRMVRASGQQFDQAYLSYITQQGQEAVPYLEKIASQHDDQQIQQFARQQLSELRQHLQQAQRAQTQIRAGGQIREPSGAEGQQVQQQVQQLERQVQQLQQQVQQLQGQQGGQQDRWQSGQQDSWRTRQNQWRDDQRYQSQAAGQQELPEAREFVKMAAAYTKLCIALDELAQEKAQSQEVHQLARQQQQSSQRATQRLRQLGQQHGVQVDVQPIQQLIEASGSEFDQAYLRLITEQHRQAVQELQRAANQHDDQDIQQFARQQLPEMRDHMQQAQRLQSQIQAGGIYEPSGAEQQRREQQERDE